MSGEWELVIVGLLVAGAGTWAVRGLLRAVKKPGGCSSCAGSGTCPVVKGVATGTSVGDCGPQRTSTIRPRARSTPADNRKK